MSTGTTGRSRPQDTLCRRTRRLALRPLTMEATPWLWQTHQFAPQTAITQAWRLHPVQPCRRRCYRQSCSTPEHAELATHDESDAGAIRATRHSTRPATQQQRGRLRQGRASSSPASSTTAARWHTAHPQALQATTGSRTWPARPARPATAKFPGQTPKQNTEVRGAHVSAFLRA